MKRFTLLSVLLVAMMAFSSTPAHAECTNCDQGYTLQAACGTCDQGYAPRAYGLLAIGVVALGLAAYAFHKNRQPAH